MKMLSIGAVMGGVFSAIFTTDVLGFSRIYDWFPNELDFDWGSFLGGLSAGAIAILTFYAQRRADRNDALRNRLLMIEPVCSEVLQQIQMSDLTGEVKACDDLLNKRISDKYDWLNMKQRLVEIMPDVCSAYEEVFIKLTALPRDDATPEAVRRVLSKLDVVYIDFKNRRSEFWRETERYQSHNTVQRIQWLMNAATLLATEQSILGNVARISKVIDASK